MAAKKKSTWGGRREGSGRKVEIEGARTKSIVFDRAAMKAVRQYIRQNPRRDEHGRLVKNKDGGAIYPGFSAAVRAIIKRASTPMS